VTILEWCFVTFGIQNGSLWCLQCFTWQSWQHFCDTLEQKESPEVMKMLVFASCENNKIPQTASAVGVLAVGYFPLAGQQESPFCHRVLFVAIYGTW